MANVRTRESAATLSTPERVQLEFLQVVLTDEPHYPWNPISLGAEHFFKQLEDAAQGHSLSQADAARWRDLAQYIEQI